MKFAQPHILWLLLVFPPGLLVFFWWSWRRKHELMLQFIQARLLPALTIGLSPARQKLRMVGLIVAVVCLILALARPQWGYTNEEVRQRGLDIVVALDVSKSMLATDVAPNRLARAKLAVQDLMRLAKTDRLGLVGFAGSAFLQCPLTLDDMAFRQSLEALNVGSISEGGTALADAIDTALAAFKEENNHKVLVLITDGEDHDSGALEAGQKAAKEGLHIFTIGVGTPEGDLLRFTDAKGRTDFVRDEQGNVVKSHLNAELLQQVASASEGGFYLPLQGTRVMETLYELRLAPLPKSEGKEKFIRRYHEQFHWPLVLGILLLALEMLWPEAKKVKAHEAKVQPEPGPPLRGGERTSAATVAAAVLISIVASIGVTASPASALRDYKTGKFERALKEYERLIAAQKDKDDPRLHFNAGAAAYRATNYDAALKQFSLVLSARDVKLQQVAYFNLGNTQFRLGTKAKDLDALQQHWESAVKSYQHAVELDNKDADAAFNLAFAKNAVEQIKLMREAALQARLAADREVRRRNYHRAREIMESLLQHNIAAKPFEEFAKKLTEIDEIANPSQPQPQP